ncbi:MAG: hypothetical protein M9924_12405 [Rhizobiaceae bacterium]|nr:hypothetical protein [Rhizobiaceae bacterium]
MDSYHFWKDFFDAYRSSSDAIKALWIVVPPCTLIALTWIVVNAPLFRRSRLVDIARPLIPLPRPSPRSRGEGG